MGMASGLVPIYDMQRYSEAEAERLNQSHRKISSKKTIRFRGQANLFEDVSKKMMPKEYVFYRVIVLPYFQFPVLMAPSLQLKGFDWNNIPDGTKRFWAKAKQELIEQITQHEKANPKIIL